MRKKIAVAVITAIVVGVLCFAVSKLNLSKNNGVTPGADSTGNSAVSEYNTIKLFDVPSEDILKISITNSEFEYFLEKNNDEWLMDGDSKKKLSQTNVSNFVANFANLSADNIITENGSPEDFGFGNSEGEISLLLKDNSVVKFYVGDKTAAGTYYFMKDGDSNIYEISSYRYEILFNSPNSLRKSNLLSVDYMELSEFSLKRNDADVKLVKKTEAEIKAEGKTLNNWKMVSPFTKDCSASSLQAEVFDKITDISAISFYESDVSSYSKYGLTTPRYVITFKTGSGDTHTIKLGNEAENEIYVLVDGDSTVYGVSKEAFSYKDVQPLNILDSIIYIKSIDLIDKITVSHADKEIVMSIKRAADKLYFVNGVSASEDSFKKAYQSILSVFLRGTALEQTGELVCKITVSLTDGSNDVIEYYKSGDRYANVSVNGVTQFYVMLEDVETMLDIIDNLAKNPTQ